jgi:hypothetical protein
MKAAGTTAAILAALGVGPLMPRGKAPKAERAKDGLDFQRQVRANERRERIGRRRIMEQAMGGWRR